MPKRKLIGLTGPSSFTPQCIETIEEFYEANFVLLYHGTDENTNYWLEQVDGVILSGGIDVHPTVYGASVWNNQNLSKFDIKRDLRELTIIDYCVRAGKPMLGICRGHQLIGIYHGLQFLMDISNSDVCHQPKGQGIQTDPKEPMHVIKIINQAFYDVYKMPKDVPERRVLRDIFIDKKVDGKGERVWVNSFHHQAIHYIPKHDYHKQGVTVIGTGLVDIGKVQDIIELMQGPRWVSCQWHPEYDWKDNTASRVVLSYFKTILGT